MSASRLCASALVFAGFAICGSVKRARRAYALELLRGVASDVRELASRLILTRSPLEVIADSISANSSISEFWLRFGAALKSGAGPAAAFETANQGFVAEEAAVILSELFSGFGSSDAETEVKKLERAAAMLDLLIAEKNAGMEKSNRLSRSLSVLTGLAAALLLL